MVVELPLLFQYVWLIILYFFKANFCIMHNTIYIYMYISSNIIIVGLKIINKSYDESVPSRIGWKSSCRRKRHSTIWSSYEIRLIFRHNGKTIQDHTHTWVDQFVNETWQYVIPITHVLLFGKSLECCYQTT